MAFGKRIDIEGMKARMQSLRKEANELYVDSLDYRAQAAEARLKGDTEKAQSLLEAHRAAREEAARKVTEAQIIYEKTLQDIRDAA